MKNYFKKLLDRVTASSLLVIFSLSSLTGSPSLLIAASEAPFHTAVPFSLDLLPAELGTLKALQPPAAPEAPFIIHIQDVHANPEAQTQIHQILKWIHAQQKDRPLQIGLEGAVGEIHPEYFDFTRRAPFNDAVVADLHQKGELTGAELFAWEMYKRNPVIASDRRERSNLVSFTGVETPELYRENLKTYRTLLYRADEIEAALAPLRAELDKKKSRELSPALRDFFRERDRRKEGKFGAVNETPDASQMDVYLKYLAQKVKEHRGIDLADPIEQIRFPNITRLLALERLQKNIDPAKAAAEEKKVLSEVKARARTPKDRELYARLEKLEAVREPRTAVEDLWEFALAHRMDLKAFPHYLKQLGRIILQSEIETAGLFDEAGRLEGLLVEKLAASRKEKELVKEIENFSFLEKLLTLKLTREEYGRSINMSSPKGFIGDPKFLDSRFRGNDKLRSFYHSALRFYQTAEARDQALIENTLSVIARTAEGRTKQSPITVLITGGFHTDGLTQLLREKGMGFAVIQPRFSHFYPGLSEKVFKDEHAGLSHYFKKNPFNKQESLFLKAVLESALPVAVKADILNHHPLLSRRLTAKAGDSGLELVSFPRKREFITSAPIGNPNAVGDTLLMTRASLTDLLRTRSEVREEDSGEISTGISDYELKSSTVPILGALGDTLPVEQRTLPQGIINFENRMKQHPLGIIIRLKKDTKNLRLAEGALTRQGYVKPEGKDYWVRRKDPEEEAKIKAMKARMTKYLTSKGFEVVVPAWFDELAEEYVKRAITELDKKLTPERLGKFVANRLLKRLPQRSEARAFGFGPAVRLTHYKMDPHRGIANEMTFQIGSLTTRTLRMQNYNRQTAHYTIWAGLMSNLGGITLVLDANKKVLSSTVQSEDEETRDIADFLRGVALDRAGFQNLRSEARKERQKQPNILSFFARELWDIAKTMVRAPYAHPFLSLAVGGFVLLVMLGVIKINLPVPSDLFKGSPRLEKLEPPVQNQFRSEVRANRITNFEPVNFRLEFIKRGKQKSVDLGRDEYGFEWGEFPLDLDDEKTISEFFRLLNIMGFAPSRLLTPSDETPRVLVAQTPKGNIFPPAILFYNFAINKYVIIDFSDGMFPYDGYLTLVLLRKNRDVVKLYRDDIFPFKADVELKPTGQEITFTVSPRSEAREVETVQKEAEGFVASLQAGTPLQELIRPYLDKVPGVTPEQVTEAERDIAAAYTSAKSQLRLEDYEFHDRAFALGLILHADQPRASKGDNRPYFIHVAGVVKFFLEEFKARQEIADAEEFRDGVAAAWNHDTVEDAKKGRWGKSRIQALGDSDSALREEVGQLLETITNKRVRENVQALSKPNYDDLGLKDEIEIEAQYYRELGSKPLATQLIKAADFSFNLGDLKNHPDRKFPQKFFLKRLEPVLGFLPRGKISYAAKATLVQFIRRSVTENTAMNAAKNDPANAPAVLSEAQEALLLAAERQYVPRSEARNAARINPKKKNYRLDEVSLRQPLAKDAIGELFSDLGGIRWIKLPLTNQIEILGLASEVKTAIGRLEDKGYRLASSAKRNKKFIMAHVAWNPPSSVPPKHRRRSEARAGKDQSDQNGIDSKKDIRDISILAYLKVFVGVGTASVMGWIGYDIGQEAIIRIHNDALREGYVTQLSNPAPQIHDKSLKTLTTSPTILQADVAQALVEEYLNRLSSSAPQEGIMRRLENSILEILGQSNIDLNEMQVQDRRGKTLRHLLEGKLNASEAADPRLQELGVKILERRADFAAVEKISMLARQAEAAPVRLAAIRALGNIAKNPNIGKDATHALKQRLKEVNDQLRKGVSSEEAFEIERVIEETQSSTAASRSEARADLLDPLRRIVADLPAELSPQQEASFTRLGWHHSEAQWKEIVSLLIRASQSGRAAIESPARERLTHYLEDTQSRFPEKFKAEVSRELQRAAAAETREIPAAGAKNMPSSGEILVLPGPIETYFAQYYIGQELPDPLVADLKTVLKEANVTRVLEGFGFRYKASGGYGAKHWVRLSIDVPKLNAKPEVIARIKAVLDKYVSRAEARASAAAIEKGRKYWAKESATTPTPKDYRPSTAADIKDIARDFSPEDLIGFERQGAESVNQGEGYFASLIAGASSRMNPAELPLNVREILDGKEVLSKAAVPIGKWDGEPITYLGEDHTNLTRLFRQIEAEAKKAGISTHVWRNTAGHMSNDAYRPEHDAMLKQNHNYGLKPEQIRFFHQPLGPVYYARPEAVEALHRDGKFSSEDAYQTALAFSKAAEAAFNKEHYDELILPGELQAQGHGEFWHQLVATGELLYMIDSGKKWGFVRNIDNVPAKYDKVFLQLLGFFLKNKLDFLVEGAPNFSGHKGGKFYVTPARDHRIDEDPNAKAGGLNPQDASHVNNAVAFFTPKYVISLYKKQGQTDNDFIQELRQASPEERQAIAERGRSKFPVIWDAKPSSNGAIYAKGETNMWQSTMVQGPDIKILGIGVGGSRNFPIERFLKEMTPAERETALASLRFIATKNWTKPDAEIQKARTELERAVRHPVTDLELGITLETYVGNSVLYPHLIHYSRTAELVTPGIFSPRSETRNIGASPGGNGIATKLQVAVTLLEHQKTAALRMILDVVRVNPLQKVQIVEWLRAQMRLAEEGTPQRSNLEDAINYAQGQKIGFVGGGAIATASILGQSHEIYALYTPGISDTTQPLRRQEIYGFDQYINNGTYQEDHHDLKTHVVDFPQLKKLVRDHQVIVLDQPITTNMDYETYRKHLMGYAMELGKALREVRDGGDTSRKVFIVSALVGVGTSERIFEVIKYHAEPKNLEDLNFDVVYKPDFSFRTSEASPRYVEPYAVFGLRDSLTSAERQATANILRSLYDTDRLRSTEVEFTGVRSAEQGKDAVFIYLPTKYVLYNEFGPVSQRYKADLNVIGLGSGLDKRIRKLMMNPSLGFGGRLLMILNWIKEIRLSQIHSVEDPRALLEQTASDYMAAIENPEFLKNPKQYFDLPGLLRNKQFPKEMHLLFWIEVILRANRKTREQFQKRIEREAGGLSGKEVTLIGVGYSRRTGQVTESPALDLIDWLIRVKKVGKVIISDPEAEKAFEVWRAAEMNIPEDKIVFEPDLYEAIRRGVVTIIATDSNSEIDRLDIPKFLQAARGKIIFDGINLLGLRADGKQKYTFADFAGTDYRYIGVGRPEGLADSQIYTPYNYPVKEFHQKSVAVIGGGYVGLVTAANLAHLGHKVHVVELDESKVRGLNEANTVVPIYEPGLKEMINEAKRKGLIKFSSDYSAALQEATLVYLAVGTPQQKTGAIDLTQILNATRKIGDTMKSAGIKGRDIIVKSTVTPSAFDQMAKVLASSGLTLGTDYSLGGNPEFLKEGTAIEDVTKPDRTVLAVYWRMPEAARDRLAHELLELYQPILPANPDQTILVTGAATGAWIKYASNAALATSISLANFLARDSEQNGSDSNEVAKILRNDPRIGKLAFVRPGCGYGGSCFPKDVKAVASEAFVSTGIPIATLSMADQSNDFFQTDTVEGALNIISEFPGAPQAYQGMHIALMGLTFKPGTDDMRESPALAMIYELLERGVSKITIQDPIFTLPDAPDRQKIIQQFYERLSDIYKDKGRHPDPDQTSERSSYEFGNRNGVQLEFDDKAEEALASNTAPIDVVFIATDHPQYKNINFANLHLRPGTLIYDTRGVLTPAQVQDILNAGLRYKRVGSSLQVPPARAEARSDAAILFSPDQKSGVIDRSKVKIAFYRRYYPWFERLGYQAGNEQIVSDAQTEASRAKLREQLKTKSPQLLILPPDLTLEETQEIKKILGQLRKRPFVIGIREGALPQYPFWQLQGSPDTGPAFYFTVSEVATYDSFQSQVMPVIEPLLAVFFPELPPRSEARNLEFQHGVVRLENVETILPSGGLEHILDQFRLLKGEFDAVAAPNAYDTAWNWDDLPFVVLDRTDPEKSFKTSVRMIEHVADRDHYAVKKGNYRLLVGDFEARSGQSHYRGKMALILLSDPGSEAPPFRLPFSPLREKVSRASGAQPLHDEIQMGGALFEFADVAGSDVVTIPDVKSPRSEVRGSVEVEVGMRDFTFFTLSNDKKYGIKITSRNHKIVRAVVKTPTGQVSGPYGFGEESNAVPGLALKFTSSGERIKVEYALRSEARNQQKITNEIRRLRDILSSLKIELSLARERDRTKNNMSRIRTIKLRWGQIQRKVERLQTELWIEQSIAHAHHKETFRVAFSQLRAEKNQRQSPSDFLSSSGYELSGREIWVKRIGSPAGIKIFIPDSANSFALLDKHLRNYGITQISQLMEIESRNRSEAREKASWQKEIFPLAVAAPVTAFQRRKGSITIDEEATRRLLSFVRFGVGANAMLAAAATGEFAVMTKRLRQKVIGAQTRIGKQFGFIVIANITGKTKEEVFQNAQLAAKSGADAYIFAPLYFLNPSQILGFTRQLRKFLAAGGILKPLLYYDNPVMAGVHRGKNAGQDIPASVVKQATQEGLIDGIKATTSEDQVSVYLSGLHPRLYVGMDTNILKGLEEGAWGAIGGLMNLLPQEVQLVRSKNKKERRKLQKEIKDLAPVITVRGTKVAQGIKYALYRLGILRKKNTIVLAGEDLTPKEKAAIDRIIPTLQRIPEPSSRSEARVKTNEILGQIVTDLGRIFDQLHAQWEKRETDGLASALTHLAATTKQLDRILEKADLTVSDHKLLERRIEKALQLLAIDHSLSKEARQLPGRRGNKDTEDALEILQNILSYLSSLKFAKTQPAYASFKKTNAGRQPLRSEARNRKTIHIGFGVALAAVVGVGIWLLPQNREQEKPVPPPVPATSGEAKSKVEPEIKQEPAAVPPHEAAAKIKEFPVKTDSVELEKILSDKGALFHAYPNVVHEGNISFPQALQEFLEKSSIAEKFLRDIIRGKLQGFTTSDAKDAKINDGNANVYTIQRPDGENALVIISKFKFAMLVYQVDGENKIKSIHEGKDDLEQRILWHIVAANQSRSEARGANTSQPFTNDSVLPFLRRQTSATTDLGRTLEKLGRGAAPLDWNRFPLVARALRIKPATRFFELDNFLKNLDSKIVSRVVWEALQPEAFAAEVENPVSYIPLLNENGMAPNLPARLLLSYHHLSELSPAKLDVVKDFLARNPLAVLMIHVTHADAAALSNLQTQLHEDILQRRIAQNASKRANLIVSTSEAAAFKFLKQGQMRALVYSNQGGFLTKIGSPVGEGGNILRVEDDLIGAERLKEASSMLAALRQLVSSNPIPNAIVSAGQLLAQNLQLRAEVRALLAKAA